jgi:hypothetical protein
MVTNNPVRQCKHPHLRIKLNGGEGGGRLFESIEVMQESLGLGANSTQPDPLVQEYYDQSLLYMQYYT